MHFRLSPLPGKPQVHKQVKAGHLGPPYPRSRTQRKGWLPLQAFKLTPSPPHPPPQPGLFQVIKNETLEGNKTSPLTVFSLLPSELLKPVPRSSPEPLSGWKGGRRTNSAANTYPAPVGGFGMPRASISALREQPASGMLAGTWERYRSVRRVCIGRQEPSSGKGGFHADSISEGGHGQETVLQNGGLLCFKITPSYKSGNGCMRRNGAWK